MTDILDTAAEVAERFHATWKGTRGCEVPRNPAQARDGYEALVAMIEEVKQSRRYVQKLEYRIHNQRAELRRTRPFGRQAQAATPALSLTSAALQAHKAKDSE